MEETTQAVKQEAEMESTVCTTHLLAEFPSARIETKLGQKIHKNKLPIIENISEW
jgi:hypothetical protein